MGMAGVALLAAGALVGGLVGYFVGYVNATAKGAELVKGLAQRWGSQLEEVAQSMPPSYTRDMLRATIAETDLAQINAAEVLG